MEPVRDEGIIGPLDANDPRDLLEPLALGVVGTTVHTTCQ